MKHEILRTAAERKVSGELNFWDRDWKTYLKWLRNAFTNLSFIEAVFLL